MTASILVLDDDQFLTKSLEKLLLAQGHFVEIAHRLEDGWDKVQRKEPDLLILDLSLPDGDGLALCKRIRERYTFPILMLTSRGESIDKVVGLEVGADDYLTKPFDPHELIGRVRALIRRYKSYSAPRQEGHLTVGPLKLDLGARIATIRDAALELTSTEFDLMAYLATHPGKAIHRDEIFSGVWGYSSEFSSNSLDVLIYRLRTKLKAVGAENMIATVRGFGFKLLNEE